MARRRISLITLSLFVLIVILTSYCYILQSGEGLASSSRQLKKYNYYQKKDTPPQLCPSNSKRCKNNQHTLTRLGTNLSFNPFKSCPINSLMVTKKSMLGKTENCPKVFIIGAKKGGTTSLYQYLSRHPDFEGIGLNDTKWVGETFYFAQKYMRTSLPSYLKKFPKNKMSGDASVDNLLHCRAPLRIWKTCGPSNIKVIILLRNPIYRYVSNFMMRVQKDSYVKYTNVSSINDEVQKDVKSLEEKMKLPFPNKSSKWYTLRCLFECCQNMIYEGLYYVFVMNWLCNFPKERIIFINSEELFYNPVLVLRQVLNFVGLRPLDDSTLADITSHVYNKGTKPYKSEHHLSPVNRQILLNYYSVFNDALLSLLDWNQLDWS